jgi:ElaB/YqjD/DUF883 family membrane-anchored ribosome-binding protein
MQQARQAQERLIGDLRVVIQNAEELMSVTNRNSSSDVSSGRAKLANALSIAYKELAHLEGALVGQKAVAAQAANDSLNKSWDKRILRMFRIKR